MALIDLDLETQGAGVHLAQKLSKEFDIPLIFVTGQVELARAHATHALGLLSKPFEAGDVAEVLTYLRTSLAGEHPSPPRTRAFEPFP